MGVIYPTVNYTAVGTTFAQKAEPARNHDSQVGCFVFVNALRAFILLSHGQSEYRF